MATIESLQAQVIALQASEAKLTAEVDLLQGHIEEYKGEWEDALAGSAPLTMYSNDPKDWENHPFLKDKVAEVEKLKTSLQTMNEVLEGSAGQKIESLQAEVMALQELWLKEQAENEKLKAENEQLKGRVDIMEKCKKVWYDKCQEDPDDDPDRNGIKWSVCLEGGLNYWMNEADRYESSYDEVVAKMHDIAHGEEED